MKSIVNQSKKNSNKNYIALGIFIFAIIILIAINPSKYSAVAKNGIEVWAKILLPSLLPFFILTKLLASTGVVDGICSVFSPVMTKLYKCPSISCYSFFMSIITGYPVGSKLISDLYNIGKLTKNEAIKATSFCSNSGPMFILGSVAIGMFADKKMGVIILISHILGALANGLLYRNYGEKCGKKIRAKNIDNVASISALNVDPNKSLKNNEGLAELNKFSYTKSKTFKSTTLSNEMLKSNADFIDFSQSVASSVNSILLIGGVICFTFVILEVITSSHLYALLLNAGEKIGPSRDLFSALFCGLGEITKGCLMLSSVPLPQICTYCLCTFIISFGGISTFLQSRAFLKDIVTAKIFLLQKITHAILSTIICAIIFIIF